MLANVDVCLRCRTVENVGDLTKLERGFELEGCQAENFARVVIGNVQRLDEAAKLVGTGEICHVEIGSVSDHDFREIKGIILAPSRTIA